MTKISRGKGKTVRFNEDYVKAFDKLYPDLFTLYLNRALYAATQSRELFDQIFFMPLLNGKETN